jgi:hypothetical protein
MQITLTPADMAVELVIALIAGGIIALVAWIAPNLLTWRAYYSKRSAARRIERLREQLREIEDLRNDLASYVGLLIRWSLVAMGFAAVSVVLLLLWLSTDFSLIEAYIGIDKPIAPSWDTSKLIEHSLRFVCSSLSGASFGAVFIWASKVWDHSDLKNYEKRLQRQIDKLNDRWGVEEVEVKAYIIGSQGAVPIDNTR